MGCHSLLRRKCRTQGLNLDLLHCSRLYCLSHLGSLFFYTSTSLRRKTAKPTASKSISSTHHLLSSYYVPRAPPGETCPQRHQEEQPRADLTPYSRCCCCCDGHLPGKLGSPQPPPGLEASRLQTGTSLGREGFIVMATS